MEYFFDKWWRLKEKMADKIIYLFLDYDGTLTPIVDSPQKALISKKTRKLLRTLSTNPRCKIAIISGRQLRDIKKKIGLKNIVYVGNHGLEIEGPRIRFSPALSSTYRKTLEQIKNGLTDKLPAFKGAFIEEKGLSLSLHFRLVKKGLVPQLKTAFHEVVIAHLVKERIRIKSGKMVLEVRPALNWDKGKVVLWLLARQEFASKKNSVLPIYIGDDLTDEDAFRALGNRGITIFVGNPKLSAAKYYLSDTQEVKEMLGRILALRKA